LPGPRHALYGGLVTGEGDDGGNALDRPFVFGLARRYGLHGSVRNRTGDVFIEVEGARLEIERFLRELTARPPPLARIDDICTTAGAPIGEREFRILNSSVSPQPTAVVVPDAATCEACLRELFDPPDRRYRYAFLNCTHCGPRLTIVTGVPYDRERTAMAGFPLCALCRAERDDPDDRRFHAQPIACPACGPRLAFLDSGGTPVPEVDPVARAIAELRRGSIVAVKGLGGYHLACNAEDEKAVAALRRRKHRDEKPFAVMVSDLGIAEALCEVSGEDRTALASSARPIVLFRSRDSRCADAPTIAPSVVPDTPRCLGLMLPYAPIHHLLFREGSFRALVMTSGNRTDEPIAYLEHDAFEQLRGVADAFLTHDRPIALRCDDSVLRSVGGGARPVPLRRSRGYAPLPLRLPTPLDRNRPTLAVGGDLKSTFALGFAEHAVISHHLGDLEHYPAYRAYRETIEHYERLYRVTPRRIVHDLHPDYASTRYAAERARRDGIELLAVQHHHAHMASCMAEHGLAGPAIGVCFDGAGLGLDETMWGGEFLLGGYRHVERVAHLRPVRMPGGDRAAREPWRMALAHLVAAGEDPARSDLPRRVPASHLDIARAMVERPFNAPLTSSVGRLFDAVASLVGVCDRTSFEGQAAMRLEALANGEPPGHGYAFHLDARAGALDPAPVIRAVVQDVRRGASAPSIARKFHTALSEAIVRTCQAVREDRGVNVVVLSGGVFANAILTSDAVQGLEAGGFVVHRHAAAPPNDGGLCLGQMAIAAATDQAEE
jgi:hydrogenase maturation protein HypF